MVMGAAANCIRLGAGTVWWSIGSTVVLVFACICIHFVCNELAGYVINDDGSEGCLVCFAVWEYAAGDNDCRLDGTIVKIVVVFMADHPNSTMSRLFHRNHGYVYAIVLSHAT